MENRNLKIWLLFKQKTERRELMRTITAQTTITPIKQIGCGAFGEVFLCSEAGTLGIPRFICVKRLRKNAQLSREAETSFLSEARLLNRLFCDNIISTGNLIYEEERYYITMEYVHGINLTRLLEKTRRGYLPAKIAVFIARKICLALKEAHEKRIIHRDLKPDNILISYKGRVKVGDWGSACLKDAQNLELLCGTIVYMSPEQAVVEKLDQRSDLFSLGLILYKMLTGKNPYRALGEGYYAKMIELSDISEIAKQIAKHDFAEIPKKLRYIVKKLLAPSRRKRYQNATKVFGDLVKFTRSTTKKHDHPLFFMKYVEKLFPNQEEVSYFENNEETVQLPREKVKT
ncbi:MAG TPA: serine/threonine protein kinase [Candidatus Peregrinibacteria bacterium]|nr:serine/threonine protein kinase [Candidatus Peregrinibacteria bacterium]